MGQKLQCLRVDLGDVRALQILFHVAGGFGAEEVERMTEFVDVGACIVVIGQDKGQLPSVEIGGKSAGSFGGRGDQIKKLVLFHIIHHFPGLGGHFPKNLQGGFRQFL